MSSLPENVNIATHGQIGKKFIYWVASGEQFKRPYKIPYDPKTFDQRTQRNKFIVAVQEWNKLTPEEKEEWKKKVLKTQYIMTGYNFFIRKKIKEITQMVKKITNGKVTLADGVNVIPISEVDLEKTTLIYPTYAVGTAGVAPRQEGIKCAYFSDSTHITAEAYDSSGTANIQFCYQLVEYV